MNNWYSSLSIRWKLQMQFFVVTMVTTIYNRILASHELGKMVDIAKTSGVSQVVVQQLEANHGAYIFNSFWESGLEFLLQFFIIGFVATLFVKPIKGLVEALKSVQAGDLTRGVVMSSSDEIGTLEHSFNDMLAKLNVIIRNIDESGKQMGQSAYQIAAISHEISEISHEEESRSREVTAATEQLKQISENVRHEAGEASMLAEKTEEQARVGLDTVQTNINKMEQTVEQVHRAESEIAQLQQAADKIHDIIYAIQAIAEQTNLLALNAAIEAARAGEAGRGFAVVADEVRKLAEKTSSSASEVSTIVGGLTGRVQQVTSTMRTVVEEVHSSQEKAHETAQVIELMAHNVTETASASNTIARVSREQMERLQFMDSTLQNLFQTLSENSTKVETTASIGDNLFEVTEKLNALMKGFTFDRHVAIPAAQHEKRRYPRAENSLLARVDQGGSKQEALIKDFSLTGLRLLLSDKLSSSNNVEMDVMLPCDSAEQYRNQVPLKVTGRIAWEREEKGKYLYGVEFVHPTEEQRRQIQRSFDYFDKKPVFEA